MFLIRQAKPKDTSTFVKLARMVYFINLPADERLIADKVAHSHRGFLKAAGGATEQETPRKKRSGGVGGVSAMDEDSDIFMFALEDTEQGGAIGTSQIRAHQGGKGNPNWSLKLSEKTFHSKELGQGTTHTTFQLYGDETGPSEIGGLILQPSHRGHPQRPGRLLSFVRFHFMGLYPELFSDRVIAEMMAPVSPEGDNTFWDAFGRRFIPVKYVEADRFCQHNRKFISDLLPKEEIFLSLFPLEVQNSVAVVSRETIPARRLLETLGFKYRGFVDPFDAGPHLDAPTKDISLVKQTRRVEFGKSIAPEKCNGHGIVSVMHRDGEFYAVETKYQLDDDEIRVPAEAMKLIKGASGMSAGVTPLEPHVPHEVVQDAVKVAGKKMKKKARKAVKK
jgi:arginine N-succinyltransferase